MKKEALEADARLKDVAPSLELRRWFGHWLERWAIGVASCYDLQQSDSSGSGASIRSDGRER